MTDDLDPVGSAFDDLRASALPSMRPIGVEHVVKTVRRRRNARVTLSTIAVLLVAGGVYGLSSLGGDPAVPAAQSLMSPSPAAAVPPPVATSPSALVSEMAKQPSGSRSSHRSTPNHTETKAACATSGIARRAGGAASTVILRFQASSGGAEAPCSGVHVPVFWASYSVSQDGTGSLYSEGNGTLQANRLSITFQLRRPPGCSAYFVGHNVRTVPTTLLASATSGAFRPSSGGPFWDLTHGRSGLIEQGQTACGSTPPPSAPPPSSPADSPSP